jgi:hypothetical protein
MHLLARKKANQENSVSKLQSYFEKSNRHRACHAASFLHDAKAFPYSKEL